MSRNTSNQLVILIPALNEERSIAKTINQISSKYKRIIVIDNGSTDQTAQIAKMNGAEVITEKRRGYGYACLAGIRYLKKIHHHPKFVCFLDADGADDPQKIESLLIEKNKSPYANMIMGSRFKYLQPGAMQAHAIIANRVLVFLIKLLYKVKLTDMGPLRIIDFEVLNAIKMQDTGYGWSSEMIVKCLKKGYKLKELDVPYRPRIGKSKISGSLFTSLKAVIWLTIHIFRNALK